MCNWATEAAKTYAQVGMKKEAAESMNLAIGCKSPDGHRGTPLMNFLGKSDGEVWDFFRKCVGVDLLKVVVVKVNTICAVDAKTPFIVRKNAKWSTGKSHIEENAKSCLEELLEVSDRCKLSCNLRS
eukprot:CAMPEP_0116040402 /NCGR_PEP_ID=MMETSP0321-20121206/24344_1 /TAXON_ID=163516 /ORGANISM="Leptocylindrus danicus var. danicus, Strain B650" /LENGTH=126 /DNA_ID=CAMNT_0003520223 /DNA_START=378 /DNA_END=758 /DNA_ORIENTATION=-